MKKFFIIGFGIFTFSLSHARVCATYDQGEKLEDAFYFLADCKAIGFGPTEIKVNVPNSTRYQAYGDNLKPGENCSASDRTNQRNEKTITLTFKLNRDETWKAKDQCVLKLYDPNHSGNKATMQVVPMVGL